MRLHQTKENTAFMVVTASMITTEQRITKKSEFIFVIGLETFIDGISIAWPGGTKNYHLYKKRIQDERLVRNAF